MTDIRIAQPEDEAGAVEAWRAAQAGRGLRPNALRLARVTDKVRDGLTQGLLVTAHADDRCLGMALGEPARLQDGAGDLEPEVLHLAMVFVVPEVQRQGLGSALVEALADAAWAQGYRAMTLWSRSPGFYQAIGFERTGRAHDADVQLRAELEAPLREVLVRSEGIRLGQLLKLAELVETGAEGKELLAEGAVEVNGEVELRRGRQLSDGDEIRARDQAVKVVLSTP